MFGCSLAINAVYVVGLYSAVVDIRGMYRAASSSVRRLFGAGEIFGYQTEKRDHENGSRTPQVLAAETEASDAVPCVVPRGAVRPGARHRAPGD